MTTTENVHLVDQHKNERGLNRCLQAIGLPKSTYGDVSSPAYRKNRPDGPSEDDERLMTYIREIIRIMGIAAFCPNSGSAPARGSTINGFGGFFASMSSACPAASRKRSPRPCERSFGRPPGSSTSLRRISVPIASRNRWTWSRPTLRN